MRKLLVFQHVAHEILGTLTPLLKRRGFRIRFVNFDRTPEERPSLDRYHGLVVLGGWMGVYEADRYPHIKTECELIEQALRRELPVLGICLGSQILAHTLGAHVRKHTEKEVGWCEVRLTEEGGRDPLLRHFSASERLFQMHGDTFDIPRGAVHLAESAVCHGQAFRYGASAYGLQFHLEADRAMIDRFLRDPANRAEVEAFGGKDAIARLEAETDRHLARSLALSRETFRSFLEFFGQEEKRPGHGHGRG